MEASVCGVSSFAFQGTNAHAVLVGNVGVKALPPVYGAFSLPFQQTSFYALPQTFCLVEQWYGGQGEAKFSAFLGRPGCSFLLDHVVLDRMIFPGAGYMELVSSASSLVLESGEASAAQGVLVGASIPQPLVLQPNEAAGS
eukprot:scaffold1005_cov772-Pavlova_lutheri.AAC.1